MISLIGYENLTQLAMTQCSETCLWYWTSSSFDSGEVVEEEPEVLRLSFWNCVGIILQMFSM